MIERAIYEHSLNDRDKSVDRMHGTAGTLIQKDMYLHNWLYGSRLDEKYGNIHFCAVFND